MKGGLPAATGASNGQRAAVELGGISKSYKQVVALSDVNLTVGDGELVTLLGPSGSGKSTVLGIVAGVLSPDQGRVVLNGRDVTGVPAHARGVGMVFQRYALFPTRTVRENVAFPLEVRRRPAGEIRARVDAMVALVGLEPEANRYPTEISGGQAQRVALARALVFGPAVLLMDEPLGALDRNLRLSLQEEVRRIQQVARVPALYVTHDQEEAMHLADRLVLMRDGRILAAGTPQELYATPPSAWAARFLGEANVIPVRDCCATGGTWTSGVTDFGLRVEARCRVPLPRGAQGLLVVRPEDCVISAEWPRQADGATVCSGYVTRVMFLGATQKVEVTLSSGVQLSVRCAGCVSPPPVGERVQVGWGRDHAVIVLPDGGDLPASEQPGEPG